MTEEFNLSSKIVVGDDKYKWIYTDDVKEFIKRNEDIVGKVCVRVLNASWIEKKIDICVAIEREIKEEQRKNAGDKLT